MRYLEYNFRLKYMYFLSLWSLGPITIYPLSVVVVVIVVVVVNFSHCHLLLQNLWTNFNQTCNNAYFGEWDSSLFKWRARPFPKGDNYEIPKIHTSIFNEFTTPYLEKCIWRVTNANIRSCRTVAKIFESILGHLQ